MGATGNIRKLEVLHDGEEESICQLLSNYPSLSWSIICLKKLNGMPTIQILKERHNPLPSQFKELSNHKINELDFIPHTKKLSALCNNIGVLYAEDTSKLPICPYLKSNPELQEYCLEQTVCIYNVDDNIIIAASDYRIVEAVVSAKTKGIETLAPSPLREFLENSQYENFYPIGAEEHHTKAALATLSSSFASPMISLTGSYAPLTPLIKFMQDGGYCYIKFSVRAKTNEVTNIEVFEHGAAYRERRTLSTDIDLKKLGFALKSLDNQYHAVVNSGQSAFLEVVEGSSGKTFLRTSSSNNANGDRTIVIETIPELSDDEKVIKPIGDHIDASPLKSAIKSAITKNEPIVLIIPRHHCQRYSSNIVFDECRAAQKAGGRNIGINSNYYKYDGELLKHFTEDELVSEENMSMQFLSAVAFGVIHTKASIEVADDVIKNHQNLIAITQIGKSQLPDNLARFAIDVFNNED